jgi:nucleoside-diphosphate-sugar epimerase
MLLARGARVRVLDNFLYGGGGLSGLHDNPMLEVVEGDIRSVTDMQRALQGRVQAVAALAALVGDPLCEANPSEACSVNFESTRVLGETARAAGIKRVVFASSCSVYGNRGQGIIDETCVPDPVSMYAKTRLLSEELLLEHHRDVGPVILRLATVFGLSARMRFDLMVNAMTAHAVSERKITVRTGEGWRPFVHVSDAARAFVSALEAPCVPHARVVGRRINVGADCLNRTIAEVATIVAHSVAGTTVLVANDSGDRRSYRVDFDRARRILSFVPCWSLADGIGEIAEALSDGTIRDYRLPIYHNTLQRSGAETGSQR